MDRVYEELDDAKAEIEKLRAEYRVKSELSESLKRAHNEQFSKIQDFSLKLEKQAEELNEKADEIHVVKQMYEDLKCNLKEKEDLVKRLSSVNDKLRIDSDEKLRKCEEEKRELAFSLDEANAKNMDREQKIHALNEAVEDLKGLASVSQKKCLEAEKMAKASKDLRQRDDTLLKLEEEKRNVEDQLKWKKEQFKHLEEAHEKVRNQLRAREKEWEMEKSTLLDEIFTLETNLDSQTRISKDLQSRLHMCSHALAHEESRRKYLEVQLSDSKTCFDNVFAECEEAKSKLEGLTGQRDKEIATLRDLLATKEMFYKEMEYRVRKLELENQELTLSLKEFQEAQTKEAGTYSSMSKHRNKRKGSEQIHIDCSMKLKAREAEWSSRLEKVVDDLNCCRSRLEAKDAFIKELTTELEGCNSLITQLTLQNEESSFILLVLKAELLESHLKLAEEKSEMDLKIRESEENVSFLMKCKGLEQIHRDCSMELKAKEAEWSSHLEKVVDDLSCCRSELEAKDAFIKELTMELEGCDSLIMQLTLQNEESSLMLLLLKAELMEAHIKLADKKAEINLKIMESEENVSLLMKQLKIKNTALVKSQIDIEEEREKVALLSRKVESLNHIEQQQLPLQKELDRHKEILKESAACQLHINEQVLQLKSDFGKVSSALDRANDEIAKKFCEGNEVEFELQIWKSIAERLKANLEENHQMRREIEASLLAQVTVEVTLKQEKESLLRVLEDRDRRIDDLQQQLVILDQELERRKTEIPNPARTKTTTTDLQKEAGWLEQGWVRKELERAILAQIEAERIHEGEKESLYQLVEEKGQRIDDLQKQVERLEQEWVRKELEEAIVAHIDAERIREQEKESIHQLVQERDQRIDDLEQLVRSMERDFENSTSSYLSQLGKMQAEIDLLHEAWEKIAKTEVLKEIEIQERILMIVELENDSSNLQQKLELQEKTLSRSKQKRKEIEAELEAKLLEVKRLKYQLETELRSSDALIKKLDNEKRNLVEDLMTLSSERENLLALIGELSDRISKFSSEDMQLVGILGRIVQTSDENLKDDEDSFDPVKENTNICSSPMTKKVEITILNERSPLRALNN